MTQGCNGGVCSYGGCGGAGSGGGMPDISKMADMLGAIGGGGNT